MCVYERAEGLVRLSFCIASRPETNLTGIVPLLYAAWHEGKKGEEIKEEMEVSI